MRRPEGLPIVEIARVLGISRNTVKVALGSDGRRGTGGGWWGRSWTASSPDRGVAPGLSTMRATANSRADSISARDPDRGPAGRRAAADCHSRLPLTPFQAPVTFCTHSVADICGSASVWKRCRETEALAMDGSSHGRCNRVPVLGAGACGRGSGLVRTCFPCDESHAYRRERAVSCADHVSLFACSSGPPTLHLRRPRSPIRGLLAGRGHLPGVRGAAHQLLT